MDIQIIGSSWGKRYGFDGIEQSPLSNPKSLDEFDVNIIDLSCENMWCNRGATTTVLNESNNLLSVRQMVINSTTTNIVYVLPRNIALSFNFVGDVLCNRIMIKDDIDNIRKTIFAQVFYPQLPSLSLLFENTRTEVNGIEYEADFYFKNEMLAKTKSKRSNKITTVCLSERVMATTLSITESKERLINFISYFFEEDIASDFPPWFSEVLFFDDNLQNNIICEQNRKIEEATIAIENANIRLKQNEWYKSVLCTNGAKLVAVVFKMLEQLLNCDLSAFEDEKDEDFLIQLPSCTLIGEIKGVTSNVKNDHLGQIEHHYQKYIDTLDEKGITEDVHQVLIINPFRTKALDIRDPIHEKQIRLAERNGCLIIETITLLKIFELYLEGKITSEKCIEVFSNKTGLLQLTDVFSE